MPVFSATKIKRMQNWRVILYGKPGIGKTSTVRFLKGKTLVLPLDNSHRSIAQLPNVDVWRDPKFKDGDDMAFDRIRPIESINSFIEELGSLSNYDNLFIDNITSLEKDWFVEKGRQSKNGISNEIQDYSQWTNYFARLMTTIYMTKNVNIVTTAWEYQAPFTTETGQNFNRYEPEIRSNVRDGLLGLADVVGRMVINPNTHGRGVILEGNDGVFAKNRLDDRKSTPIEKLFMFGGEKNVSTSSVSKDTGKPSKASTKKG
ncbi:AAA family ATPase [Lactobacillus sp. LC28-10]|uniref:AAA family ATPase n=1 Tax=Secundilactobacillus angelensis TaxID=2722706 RepID=A0ABX1L187_9LACO|nr:AAA family ATPase [Secundilactobacillus angelensis]MCH5463511.1 AAA family ATPase [Secundilactobacillus angelensis]NLR19639.1 AAA family ATPase [Secundilactobacillus angelensis]